MKTFIEKCSEKKKLLKYSERGGTKVYKTVVKINERCL